MKKLIIFPILLLIVTAAAIAQVVDTTHLVHTQGESILTFLKNNVWSLALLVFAFVSEWLGQTGKVKEGSIYAWILNLIGKIIKSKAKMFNIQSKKAKFTSLTVLIFAVILSGIGLSVSAQGGWKITKEDFKVCVRDPQNLKHGIYAVVGNTDSIYVKHRMFIRTAADVAFTNITYDKATKTWTSDRLLSLYGYGATMQWYKLEDGKVVETFGLSALLMSNTAAFQDFANARLFIGIMGSYRGLLTLGVNMDLKTRKFGIMPGVQLVF
jgi:hypothetical protein